MGTQSDEMMESSDSSDSIWHIELINQLFGQTLCVYEKIEIQRFVYYLIFNLSCSLSHIYTIDFAVIQVVDISKCQRAQKEMNDKLKEIFKKYMGEEFTRKPHSPLASSMKAIQGKIKKEMTIEQRALLAGSSTRWERIKFSFWMYFQGGFLLLIIFFLFKNQIYPWYKEYSGKFDVSFE